MIAYVFPGQGSQYKGMGEALFDEFSELTKIADKVLGYSIKELCLEDSNNVLGNTEYTQPALFVVNALSYYKKLKDTNIKPDYVAGHSLGEYNALLAAGAFDFETGLRLVKKRAELMSLARNGGMAAIIGLKEEKMKEILIRNGLECIDIANLNTAVQTVISGLDKDIDQAKKSFEEIPGASFVKLKVSGAFHSRYMAEASTEFGTFLENIVFRDLQIPVISNVSSEPYKNEDIKDKLMNQIKSTVQWNKSMIYLFQKPDMQIEQVGPGNVLTGMLKRIKREVDNMPALKLEGNSSHYTMAEKLGSDKFKERYHLKYAYLSGAMYRGVSSKEIVVAMAKAGMMGFFGTGGLNLSQIEEAIKYIQAELKDNQSFGMNFIQRLDNESMEEKIIDLFLKSDIRTIEASGFVNITLSLVKYRVKGLKIDSDGNILSTHKIIAKLSRPEIVELFLSPPPDKLIEKLLSKGDITQEEAELAKKIPIADDICIEGDSGGHTDQGITCVLFPAMLSIRDRIILKYQYKNEIGLGIAGGIGTPIAAAAAFAMGADFIVTGSINQCTVESNTSELVKDLLQDINVQDTDYTIAGDMFEIGAKVQVLKKGVFFPARANKLHELYKQYDSLDEIDEKTKNLIEQRYFKRSFSDIYEEVKQYLSYEELQRVEQNQKQKMALIFKWYFRYSTQQALEGVEKNKVDFQVPCGPALGAFNQWVKGTDLENWKNRHVDQIALKIMNEAAELLKQRFQLIFG